MAARPIVTNLPSNPKSKTLDRALFNKLMEEAKANKKQNTVQVLNELFKDPNPNESISVALIQSKSICDMIFTLTALKLITLLYQPILTRAPLLEKGNYKLKSNVCDSQRIFKKYV